MFTLSCDVGHVYSTRVRSAIMQRLLSDKRARAGLSERATRTSQLDSFCRKELVFLTKQMGRRTCLHIA